MTMNGIAQCSFIALFVAILTACATPPPSHPAHTQLATDKLAANSVEKGAENVARKPVLFTLPSMDQVTVANVPYKEGLTMDIYYPPGFDFSSPVPAVIFVGGIGDPILKSSPTIGHALKEIGMYISWGQLVAATGLIGINYETTTNPAADTRTLVKFTLANAPWLGVDNDHLCLWSASSNVPVALSVIADKEGEYQQSLSCAVVYYGFDETGKIKLSPSKLPLLVVAAGQDDLSTNTGIDRLVAAAKVSGFPVELIEYKEGVHAFDIFQDTDETRAIVSRTLEFMKEKLTVP
jgi:hypothetical protein